MQILPQSRKALEKLRAKGAKHYAEPYGDAADIEITPDAPPPQDVPPLSTPSSPSLPLPSPPPLQPGINVNPESASEVPSDAPPCNASLPPRIVENPQIQPHQTHQQLQQTPPHVGVFSDILAGKLLQVQVCIILAGKLLQVQVYMYHWSVGMLERTWDKKPWKIFFHALIIDLKGPHSRNNERGSFRPSFPSLSPYGALSRN